MSEEGKIKIYMDTSIPSAYYDTSKPIRQLITQKWFENNASSHLLYISVIAIDEIEELGDSDKKHNIKNLILDYKMKVLKLSEEAVNLSKKYMMKGAIPWSEPEDAYHIAIASVNHLDALASWNFRHIVSINPIIKIHEINIQNGYPIIEIGSLELFGGAEYGNV